MKNSIAIISSVFLLSCDVNTTNRQISEYDYTQYKKQKSTVKYVFDCANFSIPNNFHLIKWNDNTYGIWTIRNEWNWYMEHNDLTHTIDQAWHFKDSCEAKENLKQYLERKVTYKIVR